MIRPKFKQHAPSILGGNTRLALPLAGNYKGMMAAMLRAIFVNHYRKRVRKTVIVGTADELSTISMSTGTTPEGAYPASKIISILKRISHTYRRPFALYAKGHKYAEIAKELRLPAGTVKRHICHTIRQIRSEVTSLED